MDVGCGKDAWKRLLRMSVLNIGKIAHSEIRLTVANSTWRVLYFKHFILLKIQVNIKVMFCVLLKMLLKYSLKYLLGCVNRIDSVLLLLTYHFCY